MCRNRCGCGSCGGCGCSHNCGGCGGCDCFGYQGSGCFGVIVMGFLAAVFVAALYDVSDRQRDHRTRVEPNGSISSLVLTDSLTTAVEAAPQQQLPVAKGT